MIKRGSLIPIALLALLSGCLTPGSGPSTFGAADSPTNIEAVASPDDEAAAPQDVVVERPSTGDVAEVPTWNGSSFASVACASEVIGAILSLEDDSAIDEERVDIDLKVVDPVTGARSALEDHDMKLGIVSFFEVLPGSLEVLKNLDEVKTPAEKGGKKTVVWRRLKKQHVGFRWASGHIKKVPLLGPASLRMMAVVSSLHPVRSAPIDRSGDEPRMAEDPCLEMLEEMRTHRLVLTVTYQRGKTSYREKQEFSFSSDGIFTDLESLILKKFDDFPGP